MKKIRILLPALFLLSLATSGFVVARLHREKPKDQQQQAFTLDINQMMYPADGSAPRLIARIARYQKTDGSWRTDTTYFNGKKSTGFGQVGRGVFYVNDKSSTLDYVGSVNENRLAEEELRADAGFVREETILGFKTFLIHSASSDFYRCPALQGYPIKVVQSGGDAGNLVFETTRIQLGNPSEELFTSLPNYPVDTEKITH